MKGWIKLFIYGIIYVSSIMILMAVILGIVNKYVN